MGWDWRQDLKDYLSMYYTTPHTITNKAPTKLMFGRTIISKLPRLTDFPQFYANESCLARGQEKKTAPKASEDEKGGLSPNS